MVDKINNFTFAVDIHIKSKNVYIFYSNSFLQNVWEVKRVDARDNKTWVGGELGDRSSEACAKSRFRLALDVTVGLTLSSSSVKVRFVFARVIIVTLILVGVQCLVNTFDHVYVFLVLVGSCTCLNFVKL